MYTDKYFAGIMRKKNISFEIATIKTFILLYAIIRKKC